MSALITVLTLRGSSDAERDHAACLYTTIWPGDTSIRVHYVMMYTSD